jgi:Pyruvate/2-oxoacid:ferredoxin oxidoreductase gamma subunit
LPPLAALAKTARRLPTASPSSSSASTIPTRFSATKRPSLLPDGAVAVRFHSIGGWGAITTGKNLGAILGDLNDLIYKRDGFKDSLGNPKEVIHVSANPKYGSEKKGAPTSYFMVAAKDRIRVNCDLRHVTVVLCCDPKAFTHTNPLDGMAEGGSLVWESDRARRAGLGAIAYLGAQADHRQENSRLHTPRFRNRKEGHRPRRSPTAHARQRLPRRILRASARCSRNSALLRSNTAKLSTSNM